jgi:hypothetical protein
MKKAIIISIIACMLTACSSLVEDLNVNPNSPTTAPYSNILTGTEVGNIVLHTGEATRKAGIFCGYYTGVDRNHLSYSRYAVTTNNFNAEWNNVFVDALINALVTRQAAADVGIRGVTAGITEVIQAMTLGAATALWGDIPFDEAGQPDIVSPAFENQTTVYSKLQTLLDDAISHFASGAGRPASNADIHFDGNPTAWTEVAYTLKARYYMHTREFDKAYAAAQNGIKSTANSLMAPHGTAADNSNLNYQFFAVAVRQSDLIVSDFMASLMAPDPSLSPDFTHYRGNAKTNETGRYNFLFNITSFGTQPNTVDGLAAQAAPAAMVTYQENLLILAEAGFRINGFDKGLENLNNFRAFMATGGYLTNANPADILYDPYVASDFDNGGMENPDGISPDDALLREILEERYITFFGQLEGFNDTRRTEKETQVRVPITPNTGTELPQRFLYPTIEIDRNSNVPNPIPNFFDPTPVNE